MTASVASFLTKAQKSGTELAGPLSGALLLAAIRLSDGKGQAVRPYQLLVDDDGNLDLLSGDPPTGDAYAAPELRTGAVLPDDPRVLVYAAGALGYELVMLAPPQGGEALAAEVQGPLAKIIRKALAERQKRFRSLSEMARAIEAIQGKPTKEEERLILAAVASSTPLPPAQKLAKLELGRTIAPDPSSGPAGAPPEPARPPVFTEIPDPLETQPVRPAPPPPPPPPPPEPVREVPDVAPLRAELEAERRARSDMAAALKTRTQELALMGTRLSLLEEQVRTTVIPPLSAQAALLRDVNQLLEQRRFGEAERLLRDPVAQDNALLQFRLGQALSSLSDPSPPTLARAQAAFERAAVLDPSWAQPRAQLGVLLSRLGKRQEAREHWTAARRLDPSCPEALAGLAAPRRSVLALALSAAGGAMAIAVVALVLRSLPPPDAVARPVEAVSAASPAAAPAPAPVVAPVRLAAQPPPPARDVGPANSLPKLPPPESEAAAESDPAPRKVARSESRPRPKRVASSNRVAAEAESAKGDKALRAFDTKAAEASFASALKLDPNLAAAHRGMGMVYVLLGKNAEAKSSYARYLELAPEAPDREQIARLLSR